MHIFPIFSSFYSIDTAASLCVIEFPPQKTLPAFSSWTELCYCDSVGCVCVFPSLTQTHFCDCNSQGCLSTRLKGASRARVKTWRGNWWPFLCVGDENWAAKKIKSVSSWLSNKTQTRFSWKCVADIGWCVCIYVLIFNFFTVFNDCLFFQQCQFETRVACNTLAFLNSPS